MLTRQHPQAKSGIYLIFLKNLKSSVLQKNTVRMKKSQFKKTFANHLANK